MKYWMRFLFVILLVASFCLAVAYVGLQRWGQKPLQLSHDVIFDVPKGASYYWLSKTFASKGYIQDDSILRLYLKIHEKGSLIQRGEYLLQPGITPQQLIKKMRHGDVVQHAITLINGNTFKEMLSTLQSSDRLTHSLQNQSSAQILKKISDQYSHPEGLFYPDTYYFHKGDSDFDILMRAHKRMLSVLQDAWEARADDVPYKNAYEALIMASIVEKETAVESERSLIAGVFANRLKKNMRLQTDPTVIYGLGDDYKGNITRAHLNDFTPYNTYRIKGLPPTPIANPALPAIEAALHPQETNALYFVAKGDGSHHFSATLDEHQKAVRQYQWKRRSDYRSTPKSEN